MKFNSPSDKYHGGIRIFFLLVQGVRIFESLF